MSDKVQICRMLASQQEEERLQGLKALARAGVESDLDSVFSALGDESWRVRKEAVELFLSMPRSGELAAEVIELLHAEENAGLRNAAVEILVRLGSQAVPSLIDEIACSDHDVRKFVLDILGDIGDDCCLPAMVGALSDPDFNVRSAAAENLGKLGAVEAVPALLESMAGADLWLRFTILEALARIGEAVPVSSLLTYRDERLLRKALFDCLGRIGGVEAIPALAEGLTDNMRNVREAAALALARVSERHPAEVCGILDALAGTPAAAALAALLESAEPDVRRAALQLLGWVSDSRFARRLLDLFDDEELREEAAAALIGLGRSSACALVELWPEVGGRTRAYLAYVMGEAGCNEGLALLLVGLAASDPELKVVCAQALGKLGETAAIPQLISCLQDSTEEAREMATQALCRLGVIHREETFGALRPLLEADAAELRTCVVSILGQMDGSEVVDSLAFALKDESPLVRRAAVRALEGPASGGHLSALRLALTDEDSEVRRLAAETLGMSGDPQAVGPLELALQDEDIWVRSAAVRAFGRLAGRAVFAPVRRALRDPVGLVAIAALETLQALDAEQAYPALVEALAHDDEEVVNAALQLLVATGRSSWLADATERLLNHRHWEVRSTFIRALAALDGAGCRHLLEARLLIEGEALVRQLLQEVLPQLREAQG